MKQPETLIRRIERCVSKHEQTNDHSVDSFTTTVVTSTGLVDVRFTTRRECELEVVVRTQWTIPEDKVQSLLKQLADTHSLTGVGFSVEPTTNAAICRVVDTIEPNTDICRQIDTLYMDVLVMLDELRDHCVPPSA